MAKKVKPKIKRRRIKEWAFKMLKFVDEDSAICPNTFNHLLGVSKQALPCYKKCPIKGECGRQSDNIRPALIKYILNHYPNSKQAGDLIYEIVQKMA